MKKFVNAFCNILLFFLFLSSEVFSHHSKNGESTEKKLSIGIEKKDVQIKFCTTKVTKKNL